MTNFWKISCFSCGIDADLLIDKYSRVICRECLNESEFPEVENIMKDFDDELSESEMECVGVEDRIGKDVLWNDTKRGPRSIDEMDEE